MTAGGGELMLTGERTLPGIPAENYWFRRHEAAYLALAPFCTGAVVVDAGAGEGYGAGVIAASATRVVALDYLPDVAAHAARRYPDLTAVQADLQRLPFGAGTVEVIACLQVIEHLHDQPGFVAECARVLRPAGTLLVTTPNRLTFSPDDAAPINPFHTRELDPAELTGLLTPSFDVTRAWGLHHGRFIRGWERRNGSLIDAQLSALPDAWPPKVQRIVRSVKARDFDIHDETLEKSRDLVYVAVKRLALDD